MGGSMRAALIAMSLVLLGACTEGPIAFCDLCQNSDPALPVPHENIQRIELISSDVRLPSSATNVHFAMRCGIDCTQFIRFDAPIADARAFAASLLFEHPLAAGQNPWVRSSWTHMHRQVPPDDILGLHWWPVGFPSEVEGGDNGLYAPRGGLVSLVLLPRGVQATVWLSPFNT
jgi:hypothetical protein